MQVSDRTRLSYTFINELAYRLSQCDYIIAIGIDGKIAQQGTFEELRHIPGYVEGLSLKRSFDVVLTNDNVPPASSVVEEVPADIMEIEAAASDMARQTGDLSLYVYYFKTVGWGFSLYYLFAVVAFAFCYTFPSRFHSKVQEPTESNITPIGIWVQWWTDSNQQTPHGKVGYYLGIYALLSVATLLCLVLGCW